MPRGTEAICGPCALGLTVQQAVDAPTSIYGWGRHCCRGGPIEGQGGQRHCVLRQLSPAATSEPLGPSRTSSLLPFFPLQPLVFAVSTGQLAPPWEEQRDTSRFGVGRNALGTHVLVEQVAVMVQPRLCVMGARLVPAVLPLPSALDCPQQSQAQALWHDCR